jgi:ribosomal-protein-alanine N-acetyltransferase
MFARFTSPSASPWEKVRLESDRFYLRPISAEDAVDMYLYASDPDVVRYLPWEPAYSPEAVRPHLQEQVARRRRGESLELAIILRENGRMIGSTNLMDMRSQRGQAELGYLLAQSYWGHGIMTEAAYLTLGFGFREIGLEKVIAWADEDNIASQRVMQKLGMTFAGSETRTVKYERRPYVSYQIERAAWEETNK